MNVEYQIPSVVLEHVDSISNVTCPSSDKLAVVFDNIDYYQKAVDSWPKTNLNIINNADGCGNTPEQQAPNQRLAFSMASYTADQEKLTIEASGQMMTLNDPSLISQFTISFGHRASAEAAPSATASQAPLILRGLGGLGKIGDGVASAAGDAKSVAHSLGGDAKSVVTSAESTAKADVSSVKSDVTSAVTQAVSTAAAKASSVATDVKSVATDAKTFATDAMSKAKNGFTEGGTSTVSMSVGPEPTAKTDSPFGSAKKIGTVDGLTIWCVDCGASGKMAIGGGISANVEGITGGSLMFEALEFKIPLTFGFEASQTGIGKTLQSQLFEIPLTPLMVEPFFSIGPKFTFAVDFTVWIGTTGNLKAGANMHWSNASALIQLPDKDKNGAGLHSMEGWNPDVEKVFEFSGGELNLNATLGIPMAFNVGLTLLQHQISRSVSITDTPSIELDSTFNLPSHVRRDHPRDLAVRDDSCKNGIAELISFKNAVDFNVFDLWQTKIASFSTSLYSTCFTTATLSSSASSTSRPSSRSSSSGSSSLGSSSSSPSSQPSVSATASGLSPTRSADISKLVSTVDAPFSPHATASGGPSNTGFLADMSNPTATGWYPSVGTANPMPTQGRSGTNAALPGHGTSSSPTATGGGWGKAVGALVTGVQSLESLDISLGTSSVPPGSLYSGGLALSTPVATGAVTSDGISGSVARVSGTSSGFYPTVAAGNVSQALNPISSGIRVTHDLSLESSTASTGSPFGSGSTPNKPTATSAMVSDRMSIISTRISVASTGVPDIPTAISVTSIGVSAASTGISAVPGGVIGASTVVADTYGPPTVLPREKSPSLPSPQARGEFHGLDRVAREIEAQAAAENF